jgi:hypothetical protein
MHEIDDIDRQLVSTLALYRPPCQAVLAEAVRQLKAIACSSDCVQWRAVGEQLVASARCATRVADARFYLAVGGACLHYAAVLARSQGLLSA